MKTRLVFLILLALTLIAALALQSYWQPILFDYFQPRQDKLGLVKILLDTLNTLAALIVSVFAIYTFFLTRGKRPEEPKILLVHTSPDQIIADYIGTSGGRINWIDRGAVNPSLLFDEQRIAIIGRMKMGKTREAAELIRRMLEEGMVPERQVYDLTNALRGLSIENIRSELVRDIDHSLPKIFYINDLPQQYSGKNLDTLSATLSVLENCGICYLIITARQDQITTDHNVWIEKNHITKIELHRLESVEIQRLVDNVAGVLNLQIDDEARAEFVDYSDGTPAHIILALKRIQILGYGRVEKEIAHKFATQTLQQAWREVRKEAERCSPDVKYLFASLAVFYKAGFNSLNSNLVNRYAYSSKLSESKHSISKPLQLKKAATFLRHYDIDIISENYQYPDVSIEDIAPKRIDALSAIDNFMDNISKKNEMLYPVSTEVYEYFIIDLAYQFLQYNNFANAQKYYWKITNKNTIETNIELIMSALLFLINRTYQFNKVALHALGYSDVDFIAHNNLGTIFNDVGQPAKAVNEFRKALNIYPRNVLARVNLASTLAETGYIKDAVRHFQQAITNDPNSAFAHYVFAETLFKNGDILWAIDEYKCAITIEPEKAEIYSSLSYALFLLEDYEQALKYINQAIRLQSNEGSLYSTKAHILKRKGLIEEAKQLLNSAFLLIPDDDYYNRACFEAISGNFDKALSLLQSALIKNSKIKKWAAKDPDLLDLHGDPRFQSLVGG